MAGILNLLASWEHSLVPTSGSSWASFHFSCLFNFVQEFRYKCIQWQVRTFYHFRQLNELKSLNDRGWTFLKKLNRVWKVKKSAVPRHAQLVMGSNPTDACGHMICKFLDQIGSVAMMIDKRSAGATPEVNLQGNKACKWGSHPGFGTHGRHHKKSKTRVLVDPQKRRMSSKMFLKTCCVPILIDLDSYFGFRTLKIS